ncbi:shikimate kinase [Paenibacillus sp. UNCCL117]|uniref:shikimate kinase n=1 Tax=unclassified Paenibacillus TaxID=185978 RepID=UPI0008908B05|nr:MULTISPECIES: shikimate kinase [unclassified Paenibacillus]SDC79208.1 shikimate kinase [Paenibacillus sp. cl123]SFW26245.1 shikimate kinase [Paenibacillus sp. UNCCL117]
MTKRNLVLIGMMGTGKSTVGHELARRLGLAFVDSDAAVEAEQGMTIKEMFAALGEAAFRTAETAALTAILAREGQVVATGGGAVLAEANRTAMKDGGFVVALAAGAETIIRRVSEDRNRPLLQGDVGERVRAIMESRRHAYDFADLRIDTDGRSVENIADEICRRWLGHDC